MKVIDLRSDTVTRPTEGMRRAMAQAEVGDDVYGEDPTVNRLQEMMAERLGMEAGLFVASGTMGNIVAVLTHGGRGDEMILGNLAHTFLYEGGAAAGLAGIHPRPLQNEPDGTIPLDAIEEAIRAENIHFPKSRLLCLENTHNRCGGAVLTPDYSAAACELAHRYGLAVHLDGARLFNAAIALGVEPSTLTRGVDSVMVCLSKGLGAPVGSVLCGSRPFIRQAKRMRKIVGGGMRQAGIIAAAGIDTIPGLACAQADGPATNLVYFTVDGDAVGDPSLDAALLSERLRARGVLANPLGENLQQMRMVTHLDLTREDIDEALSALRSSIDET
jgi:threonine aldolase